MAELHASLYEGLADEVARWESLTPEQRAAEEARSAAKAAAIEAEVKKEADAHQRALHLLEPVISGLIQAGVIDRKQAAQLRQNARMGGTVPVGATEKAHRSNENPPAVMRKRKFYLEGELTWWFEYEPLPCIATCGEKFGAHAEVYIGITADEVIAWTYRWPMKNPKIMRAARS